MDTALRAGVAVLERSVAYCLGSVTLVAPAMLARPTPCAGWNLLDLLEHVIDSMAALEEAVTTGRVTMTPPAEAGGVIDTRPVDTASSSAAIESITWSSRSCRFQPAHGVGRASIGGATRVTLPRQ